MPPGVPLLPTGKLARRDELAQLFRAAWVARSFSNASWEERWRLAADLFPVPAGAGRPAARWAAFEGYVASLLRYCAFTTDEIDAVFADMGWAFAVGACRNVRAARRLRERRRRALETLQVRTSAAGGAPSILPQPSTAQMRSSEHRRAALSHLRLIHRWNDPADYLHVVQTIDTAGESRAERVAVERCVARVREVALHPLLAEVLVGSPTFRRRCVEGEIVRLLTLKWMASG